MGMILSFRKLVYAQVILGVIAYAVAEQNAAMVLAAGTLSTLSWYVVEGPGGKPLPRWLINLGVLIVTGWLFYTQINRQKELIIGLGEFILFIQIFKLYERKNNRDYAQLIVLSLMQMVCASVLSAEVVFGVLLAAYLVLTLFTVLQFQLKTSFDEVSDAATKQAPPNQHATRPRPVVSRGHRRHFNSVAIFCGLLSMALSALLFIALPRGAGKGMLGDWAPPTRRSVSGFDDKVQLTGGVHISTSRLPVMNLSLAVDGHPYGSSEQTFLVRGLALDHYDRMSHRWTRTITGDEPFYFKKQKTAEFTKPPAKARLITQQITLRRQTGGVLFALYPPLRLDTDQLTNVSFNRVDQVVTAHEPLPGNIQYTMTSLSNLSAESRDLYTESAPNSIDWSHYARDPVLASPRVRAETLRVLHLHNLDRDPHQQSTPKDYEIAAVIEHYLQTHYTYTLDLPPVPDGVDPILAFLFNDQRGHCEYFASAMAAMLRSIGIRSRLVTGFRATEFNGVGGYYVIRELNAHAWVEVYQHAHGWRAYDPSPPGAVAAIQKPRGGIVAFIRDIYEYMEFHWINGVITYDSTQRRSVMNSLDSNLGSFTRIGHKIWAALQSWVEYLNNRFTLGSWWGYLLMIGLIVLIILSVLLLIWTVIRHRRHIRQLQLDIVSRRDQRRLARHLEFYLQMLRVLEKAGLSKPVWQTPASFAQKITAEHPDRFDPVVPLTDLFYEIRFGGRPLDAERARLIHQHLDRLRQTS